MRFLTVVPQDGSNYRFDIESEEVDIGRSAANHLVLQDDKASRSHARIVRGPGGYLISDLASRNSTFLNDHKVGAPARLSRGDRIRIGTTILVFDDLPVSPIEFSDAPFAEPAETTRLSVEAVLGSGPRDVPRTLADPALTGRSPTTPLPRGDALNILFEADQELVFNHPLPEIFRKVMALAHKAVRYERGVLLRLRNDVFVQEVVWPPEEADGDPFTPSRTILDHVRRAREAVLTSDATADLRFHAFDSVRSRHIRSVMCVPLWNNREVTGCIYVDSRRTPALFTEQDLRVLTFLGNIAAVKIENAELFQKAVDVEAELKLHEKELQAAADIQRRLLPGAPPSIPGYLVDGDTYPSLAVGGDLFDYLDLPGGRYGIGLGDVAGHGLPAALLMSTFLAHLRSLTAVQTPLDQMMALLNNLLCGRIPENRYVTFFFAILDPSRHTLTCVNAGHPTAFVFRAGGEVEPLAMRSLFLGMMPGLRFETETKALHPGDLLVCYSDGVTDSADPDAEGMGEAGLVEFIRKRQDRLPKEIMDLVVAAVDARCGGRRNRDDVTMVVLKRVS
jgi:serine phosphatase RsbU (regulator of sigma subunit)